MIKIRKEITSDYNSVYEVIKSAFEHAEHRDGNEQDLVVSLRKSSAFIPELSLVAESDGNIVGHVLFSKVKIGDRTELALAPLSVLPAFQRQGVGSALITEGHKIAKQLGFDYSIVLGSEQYYPRMGYKPASEFHILPPFDVSNENFMVYPLQGEDVKISGVVEYAKEFFES